ncbi:MAG: ATPase domain-containing protein [archaeon]|jgi:circadian clock protein KaiC
MEDVDRVKTGIPGLDALLNGGIPRENLVVISGDPGSGKTIMCMSFIYFGAKKFNEPGVFISLEETKEDVLKMSSLMGWDFEGLLKEKKVEIIAVDLYDFDKLKDLIQDTITRIGAKRLVIDPGVIFRLYFKEELEARKQILGLGKMIKATGCTAIITNESSAGAGDNDLFGLEEYVADGVILLYHKKIKDQFVRSIAVLKMRSTKISEQSHPIIITKKGIEVLSKHEVYE